MEQVEDYKYDHTGSQPFEADICCWMIQIELEMFVLDLDFATQKLNHSPEFCCTKTNINAT